MSRPPPPSSMIMAAARPVAEEGLGQLVVASRPRGFLARLRCEHSPAPSIEVHEAGIIRRDRTGALMLAWPEIAAVYEVLEEIDTPIGTRLEPKVVLESNEGRRVVIDRGIARHVDIGRIAAARAQEAMLPRFEAMLAFGRRIDLGPVALDALGLHTPDVTCSWARISFVRWERLIYRGSFSVHLLDGTVRARVPSEYVPNPRVLLALLERQGKLEEPKEAVIAAVLGAA
jgi:hypothetical protein